MSPSSRTVESSTADEADYSSEIPSRASVENVTAALTSLEGLAGWWTPLVGGDPTPGGTLQFGFAGLDETIVMLVEDSSTSHEVLWTCLANTGHPEWEGTRIAFRLTSTESGSLLSFRHSGLTRSLSCYDACERGWDHFLTSLMQYAETGVGNPF